jgi:hypothetical protein
MKGVPLRLQPGEDLRLALEAWKGAQQEQAGCLISGIGSLSVARLRLAGGNRSHGDLRRAGDHQPLRHAVPRWRPLAHRRSRRQGRRDRRAPLRWVSGAHHRRAGGRPAAGLAVPQRARSSHRLHRAVDQASGSGLRRGSRRSSRCAAAPRSTPCWRRCAGRAAGSRVPFPEQGGVRCHGPSAPCLAQTLLDKARGMLVLPEAGRGEHGFAENRCLRGKRSLQNRGPLPSTGASLAPASRPTCRCCSAIAISPPTWSTWA